MLFGKTEQLVKRILVVEDEALTAFDNESMLGDLGYDVVGTVDSFEDAVRLLDKERVDLVMSDFRLRSDKTGVDLARAAKERGVPTLFASGYEIPNPSEVAIGCLAKPYTERQIKKALECINRHLAGKSVKPQKGLTLFFADQA
ncbi:MAG TPA: response regulator [Sphingomicrobium sp.]|jgi:two-component system, response regulator PdtaR|nr:response regulator [Sphingomicrobium sp.]